MGASENQPFTSITTSVGSLVVMQIVPAADTGVMTALARSIPVWKLTLDVALSAPQGTTVRNPLASCRVDVTLIETAPTPDAGTRPPGRSVSCTVSTEPGTTFCVGTVRSPALPDLVSATRAGPTAV